jgi:hypothetical protein
MLYELRVYEIIPGRMPAMRARLERATVVFRKNGFDIAGAWTEIVEGKDPRLIYITVFNDIADRERKWNAFAKDPDWLAIEAESEKDGPIVAGVTHTFMDPASFSPLK